MRLSSARYGSLALLLPLPLYALAACGDDEVTVPPTIALEDFVQSYRDASCDLLVRCGAMPDVETCLATTQADPNLVQAAAAATFGSLSYDPEVAKVCVDAVKNGSCEAGSLFPDALTELCDPVFGDRKAEGEPCYAASECEGVGSFCDGACGASCCEGTCRPPSAGAAIGEPCSEEAPCDGDGICAYDEELDATFCVERAGAGQDCEPGGCIDGFSCDPGSGKCFQLAPAGQDCNPDLDTRVCAHIGEYCDVEERRCLTRPGVGEPCASTGTSDQVCAPYAYCAEGTCALRPTEGEACAEQPCLGTLECQDDGAGTLSCASRGATQACVEQ
jgi:hypothetical protein